MAVQTRPYLVTFNGVDRMVEAPNPATAVRHIVGAAVTELRPARGSEVSAWLRSGKPIEISGQKAPPAIESTAGVAAEPGPNDLVLVDEPIFLADDAVDWLAEHGAHAAGIAAFGHIRQEQRMTLEQFDILRTDCPDFGAAIIMALNGADAGPASIEMNDIRGRLEEEPFPLDVVIGAIADAKRHDLFVAEAEAGPAAE